MSLLLMRSEEIQVFRQNNMLFIKTHKKTENINVDETCSRKPIDVVGRCMGDG